MSYDLPQFCEDCHDALKASPNAAGREQIRRNLEKLLANEAFVETYAGPETALGTHKLYEDPEFEFVVLAHINAKGHRSPPHDHGSSWAIYGQAAEHTDMSEYRRLGGGDGAGPAELEKVRSYRLTPGKAGLYDVGAIHAIEYPDNARFVRVTGKDLDKVPRLLFDTDAKQAKVIESASAQD
tara:strand:+ start:716 stop:1261 length:546 start_codon:yes stop_codon:yes gene_type:complete